jgi:putative transposase
MSRPYSTDLTDAQWALVEPLLPPPRPRGRRPRIDRRRVLDAILYQTKNACTWRDLPRDFPKPTTVYRYFEQWRDDGTLAAVYEALHRRWRRDVGRDENPSAGALDSRSVQATSEAAERGNDSKKKVVGRKQHLCVDTEGFPLSVEVTPASANDKAAAYGLIERAAARSPRLQKLWADGAYVSGPLEAHAQAHGVAFEVVGRPEGAPVRGFAVIPRRWVVERTFAWLKRCRRLVHDFERLAVTVEAFIYLALTRLLLNRLAPRS